MPAPRIFSQAELQVARTMQACKESWRSIGRTLGCQAETIRCAIDPAYAAERMAAISGRRRERNAKAKAAAAAKEARAGFAYGSSRIQSGHPKRLGITRQGLRGIY